MKQVFISYSHKDEEWKNRLVTHLLVLEKEGHLTVWHDRKIEHGNEWYPEIEKALNNSDIALLLVTANFLTSSFVLNEEIPRLLHRRLHDGLKVLPVIVEPCAWKFVAWLSSIQVFPSDGEPLSKDKDQIEEKCASIAEIVIQIHEQVQPLDTLSTTIVPDVFLEKLPNIGNILFGREHEIDVLDAAWSDENSNVVSISAWGGAGKTALVSHWLNQMQKDRYRGAERIYAWSFYSRNVQEGRQASADVFLTHALEWFNDPNPFDDSLWGKALRLAYLIRKQRTLLILDGLEPLQYPTGEVQGAIKDEGLRTLLKELSRWNSGLCVLTSRVSFRDIENISQPVVQRVDLKPMSVSAGAQLLIHLGVKGEDKELEATVEQFGGHALALNLLGRYLAVVFSGDIRQRETIPLLPKETSGEQEGAHAQRVMESYENWLKDKPELSVLYVMGLFEHSVDFGAIAALKVQPDINGLTSQLQNLSRPQWQFTLEYLRNLKLLADEDPGRPDILACHPLVQEYFGRCFRNKEPLAWENAHSRLYDYYRNLSVTDPKNLDDLKPDFSAVFHGCQAGRYKEALHDVYYEKISRKEEAFITNKLGAYGKDLEVLSNFFEVPWKQPAFDLTPTEKSILWNWVGYALRAVGSFREANEATCSALKEAVKQKDWIGAAVDCGTLSEIHQIIGEVTSSREYAEKSVEFADRSSDIDLAVGMRTTLADALHQAGDLKQAEVLFHEAEVIHGQKHPVFPRLRDKGGYLYCDLLLTLGEFAEVKRRASQALQSEHLDLNLALYKLVLGQAYLMQNLHEETTDLEKAGEYLNQAVEALRKTQAQHHLPRGLLTRAILHRVQADFDQARNDLEESRQIAERHGMQLYFANYYLESAWLAKDRQEMESARNLLMSANDLIEKMAYFRLVPQGINLQQILADQNIQG